ncbi:MAG: hypothetical protein ABUL77_01815 [Bacteroidota bacterium]
MKKPPTVSKVCLLAVAGGLLLLGSACGSSNSSNGNDGGGGAGGGGAGGGVDTAKYNFEMAMVQGWASGGATDVLTSVMSSTAQKFAGTSSLAANITAPAAAVESYSAEINIAPPVVIAPATVMTFHVFVPADAPIDWIQPFIQEDVTYSFITGGAYRSAAQIAKGGWTNIELMVPATVVNPIYKIGVQIHNTAAWTGTVYIDSVNW